MDTVVNLTAKYTVRGAHRTPDHPEGRFLMVANLLVLARVFGLHERALERIEREASTSVPCRLQLRATFMDETAIDVTPGTRLV